MNDILWEIKQRLYGNFQVRHPHCVVQNYKIYIGTDSTVKHDLFMLFINLLAPKFYI